MVMKTLGLDLSTVTCGWCISENKNIIECGFFNISNVNNYKDKANIIINGLSNKLFDRIFVEEAVSAFSMGRTSAQTVIKLIKNKAVICYILGEFYNKEVVSIPSTTIRKNVFGKAFIKGMKSKEYVKQQIDMRYDVSKYIVKTSHGNIDKRNEDMYDAITVSLYNP